MDFEIDLAPSASSIFANLQHVLDTMVRTVSGWPLHVQIIAGLVACGVIIHIVRGLRKKPGY